MHIYTRFNPQQACFIGIRDMARGARRMKALRFDEEWMKSRIELFKHYTYPSVAAQTDQEFEWTGIIHKDSPEWFIAEFDNYPRMKIALVDWDIEVGNPNDVTVNVDSDDAINREFVEIAKLEANGRDVLNFNRGFKVRVSTGVYIATSSPRNPFNIAPAGDKTVLTQSHGTWPNTLHISNGPAMWLQVIHFDNIDNRMKRARRSKDLDYAKTVAPLFEIDPMPCS